MGVEAVAALALCTMVATVRCLALSQALAHPWGALGALLSSRAGGGVSPAQR